jgi:hypothetical protein
MNDTTTRDQIIRDYLARLTDALRDLPAARRREIVDGVAEHIQAARAEHHDERDVDVLNLLDRIGTPEEIAAASGQPETPPPRRPGAVEVGALVMMTIGGLLLPVLGWIVGIFLLWSSPLWTRRDKWIGTLLPPGGIGLTVPALALGVYAGKSCTTVLDETGRAVSTTCQDPAFWEQALGVGVVAVAVILPLATVFYLARRLRQARADHAVAA